MGNIMKKYRVFDIVWDTDDDKLSRSLPPEMQTVTPKFPSEVIIEEEDDFDPAEKTADYLSDNFGWCVKSCSFEEIKG